LLEKIYFRIGLAFAVAGLGMPYAFPTEPRTHGYLLLSIAGLLLLSATRLWLKHETTSPQVDVIKRTWRHILDLVHVPPKLQEVPIKASDVILKLTKIRFDPNGPTEIYAHFLLDNLGRPSTIKNWMLSAQKPSRISFNGVPRMIYTKVTFQPNGPPIYEDLSIDPLEEGGSRPDGYVTYSHTDPVAMLSEPGTVFRLCANDIWGGELSSEYTIA
jgi:hypothetical protein